ncbi:hypothetical protein RhiJN_05960 [Ceratobasidium sp. AG-Ba]|nr:hypothetical protein RhiJN_05960 [Ceratobasidium sp. AG-Ba]QRW06885.1 hypothetical protein RhiLY_05884 [Ceratobasidium sp. AG-Ba]
MAEVFNLENDSTIDHVLAEGASHLLADKYFMLASFVILVYDHLITFSEEVRLVFPFAT